MVKLLSDDLRSCLIAAVDAGMSRREAAERFGVAVATSVRWASAWRRDRATCAWPRGGDIVMMDNLPAHNSVSVRTLNETVGPYLLHLPP